MDIEGVAGLGVLHRMVLRLELVGRRGLDVLDDPVIPAAQAEGDEFFGVGAAGDGFKGVVVPFGAVPAEDRLLLLLLVPEADVSAPDEGLPLAVRGRLDLLRAASGAGPISHPPNSPSRKPRGPPGPSSFLPCRRRSRGQAGPAGAGRGEFDRLPVLAEREREERPIERLDLLARSRRQACRQPGMIEGDPLLLACRIDEPISGLPPATDFRYQ